MAVVDVDMWYIDRKGYRSPMSNCPLGLHRVPQRSMCKTLIITLHVLRPSNLECVYASHARNNESAIDLQEKHFKNVGVCTLWTEQRVLEVKIPLKIFIAKLIFSNNL